MPRVRKQAWKSVESYTHETEKRTNVPPVGLVSTATDPIEGKKKYEHDPHIDPQLSWAGKKEGTSFEVPNVSLHVHERIDPQRIIKNFLKKGSVPTQRSLFEEPENELPISKAIEFYKHSQDWSNRIIAGDSLLVMNSLLSKESMNGKVQMIYIDPPYGIKYNSNFQPFVNKREVKDGKDEDLSSEPEMIKAFRDTWELGIHSYLTYLRDRLFLARDLLSESGSVFVQISDENVHHVREIMDEIFSPDNFVAIIPFRKKTMPLGAKYLEQMFDFILWYSRKRETLKYHQLFQERNYEGDFHWQYYEMPDGSRHKMTKEEIDNHALLPKGARVFRLVSMWPPTFQQDAVFEVDFRGKKWLPAPGACWPTNAQGMKKLAAINLLEVEGKYLRRIVYEDEARFAKITANWADTIGTRDRRYVVQTSEEVVKRCMLMTTDPGELVFDPTCGSGTTAAVAEEWGRRWITCDTSRVAISIAKQRIMTSKFPYFRLAHGDEGIRSGFEYNRIDQGNLKELLSDDTKNKATHDLFDQPKIDNTKVRVAGPFTVEAVPCLQVRPLEGRAEPAVTEDTAGRTGAAASYEQWMDELRASGIRGIKGKTIGFTRLEPLFGTQWLQAEGETSDGKRIVVCFGPDFGPLEQRQVEMALKEARSLEYKPEIIVFAAFQFDPEAGKDIDLVEWKGVQILKAQMSADLFTSDLRKKRISNQSYWLIGQPDIALTKEKDGRLTVSVRGFDYYDPSSGNVVSHGAEKIVMWMLDTDYDEQSLLPDQVFFPMKDIKRDWTPLAKTLNGAVDEDLLEAYTSLTSLPFEPGDNGKIAVKIVDDRGIESLVIKTLP